jgi:hypothetical protein
METNRCALGPETQRSLHENSCTVTVQSVSCTALDVQVLVYCKPLFAPYKNGEYAALLCTNIRLVDVSDHHSYPRKHPMASPPRPNMRPTLKNGNFVTSLIP